MWEVVGRNVRYVTKYVCDNLQNLCAQYMYSFPNVLCGHLVMWIRPFVWLCPEVNKVTILASSGNASVLCKNYEISLISNNLLSTNGI